MYNLKLIIMDVLLKVFQFIAYLISLLVNWILNISLSIPCTVIAVPLFFLTDQIGMLLLFALLCDLLISTISYSLAYSESVNILMSRFDLSKHYTKYKSDLLNDILVFDKAVWQDNNISRYISPIILAIDFGEYESFDYTSYPSYDYRIICIPKRTDLRYIPNQARLIHEICHSSLHSAARHQKYKQNIVLLIFVFISVMSIVVANYWTALFCVLLSPVCWWISNNDLAAKTEVQADLCSLEWVKNQYGQDDMRFVAKVMIMTRLKVLQKCDRSQCKTEINRILSLIPFLTLNDRDSIAKRIDKTMAGQKTWRERTYFIEQGLKARNVRNEVAWTRQARVSKGMLILYPLMLIISSVGLLGIMNGNMPSIKMSWFLAEIVLLLIILVISCVPFVKKQIYLKANGLM